MNINYPEIIRGIFEKEFSLKTFEHEEGCMLLLPLSCSGFSTIWNIHAKTSGTVKYITCLAKNVPENKKAALYAQINKLQKKYYFIRMYFDRDSNLMFDYDFCLMGEDPVSIRKCTLLLFDTLNSFLAGHYAEIMKCVWTPAEIHKM